MNKEEYYNRLNKITSKISSDRVSKEEEYNLICQKNYLATNYIKRLENENKILYNKIDKAIDVIHTQMKNNPTYKENLKIIENNLIKGSSKVCDLKDSDVDE